MMVDGETHEQRERLQSDIDLRVSALMIGALDEVPAEHHDALAAYMRAAYGQGYVDSINDDRALLRENGYTYEVKDGKQRLTIVRMSG